MDIGDELVQQIVRRILTVVRPDRIILFGSAGSGQMTRDSDIDLLVFEAQPSNRHERNRRREVSVDVIVLSTGRFRSDQRRLSAGLAIRPISTKGPRMKEVDDELRLGLLRDIARRH